MVNNSSSTQNKVTRRCSIVVVQDESFCRYLAFYGENKNSQTSFFKNPYFEKGEAGENKSFEYHPNSCSEGTELLFVTILFFVLKVYTHIEKLKVS